MVPKTFHLRSRAIVPSDRADACVCLIGVPFLWRGVEQNNAN